MQFPFTCKFSSTLILNQPEEIQRRVTKIESGTNRVVTEVAGALVIIAMKSLKLAEYMEFPFTWKVRSTLILNQPE